MSRMPDHTTSLGSRNMTTDTSAFDKNKSTTLDRGYGAEAATSIAESEYAAIVENRKSFRPRLAPKGTAFEWVPEWFTRQP
jgi:hypothetical protein